MTTAPVTLTAGAESRARTTPITATRDVAAITWRNLLRYRRVPQLLVFSTIQPVMFVLLFVFVFGGAIAPNGSTSDYANFLIPGILVQTTAFGGSGTAVGLAQDLSTGIIDRFRSLPMARSAVLAGRTYADSARNVFVVFLMIGVGYLVGFRFQNGFAGAVGAILLVVAFGFALSWIFALVGLTVRDPETAQVAGFLPLFPLVFASSVFVPVETMPGWLQPFAEHQPVTVTVDAVRGMSQGGPILGPTLRALLWIGAILVVFVPLAVRQYRRS